MNNNLRKNDGEDLLFSARRLYLSMMENHKFHRPDSGSKTTRSRITDIIGRVRFLIKLNFKAGDEF